MKIKTYDRIVQTLTNMMHVPELSKKLISTKALDSKVARTLQRVLS